MPNNDELLQIHSVLIKANCPREVFGEPLILDEVTKRYKSLIKITHPDLYNGNRKLVAIAEESTKLLNMYYKEVEDANKRTTKFKSNSKHNTSFKNGEIEYEISNDYKDDYFCRVYPGERKTENGVENIHLKVAKEVSNNYLLKNESDVLKKISHKSIPVLVDMFVIKDGCAANVVRTVKRSYSVTEIKEVYPEGVKQEHAVWIMDRLLSVIGYLHTNNIIHGGIEPSNILITPHNHNAILIDYVFAIDDANKPGKKYLGLNEFSAPEINKSTKPHPVTDMYSLGKTIEYIMTDKNGEYQNDVDKKLKRYLSEFTKKEPKDRVNDAWSQWRKLKELREELFGSRNQFLPFEVKLNKKKTTSDRFENISI